MLTITTIYLIRLVQALFWWDYLATLPGVSPLYLVLTGLLWTLIGLPLTWGLWQGRLKMLEATRLFALGFAAYVWLERFLAANADGEMSNWPFAAGMTLVVLGVVLWALSRPAVKAYFGEVHE
ncbi:MAG TPA: hypothetical protein VJ436_09875 [Anaerolineales bacterium]|nr:hypothetical protein [Anaerolineales bacterium]